MLDAVRSGHRLYVSAKGHKCENCNKYRSVSNFRYWHEHKCHPTIVAAIAIKRRRTQLGPEQVGETESPSTGTPSSCNQVQVESIGSPVTGNSTSSQPTQENLSKTSEGKSPQAPGRRTDLDKATVSHFDDPDFSVSEQEDRDTHSDLEKGWDCEQESSNGTKANTMCREAAVARPPSTQQEWQNPEHW